MAISPPLVWFAKKQMHVKCRIVAIALLQELLIKSGLAHQILTLMQQPPFCIEMLKIRNYGDIIGVGMR